MHPRILPDRRSRGFSLIEVLVAVLVLGVGMLGIAALQATALRNSQSAFERTQGVLQTYSIIDSMRANRNAALANQYDLASWTCDVPDDNGTLASRDLHDWVTSMHSNLGPSACGRVVCGANQTCTVEIKWDDSRASDGIENFTVSTRTRI